jgi:phage-related protein
MKPICFLGNSLESLREFPEDARQDAGYQLDQVQRGRQPSDFKSMPTVGKGVEELRVWDERGTYRVIYIASTRGGGVRPPCVPEEDPGHEQT